MRGDGIKAGRLSRGAHTAAIRERRTAESFPGFSDWTRTSRMKLCLGTGIERTGHQK